MYNTRVCIMTKEAQFWECHDGSTWTWIHRIYINRTKETTHTNILIKGGSRVCDKIHYQFLIVLKNY